MELLGGEGLQKASEVRKEGVEVKVEGGEHASQVDGEDLEDEDFKDEVFEDEDLENADYEDEAVEGKSFEDEDF